MANHIIERVRSVFSAHKQQKLCGTENVGDLVNRQRNVVVFHLLFLQSQRKKTLVKLFLTKSSLHRDYKVENIPNCG